MITREASPFRLRDDAVPRKSERLPRVPRTVAFESGRCSFWIVAPIPAIPEGHDREAAEAIPHGVATEVEKQLLVDVGRGGGGHCDDASVLNRSREEVADGGRLVVRNQV